MDAILGNVGLSWTGPTPIWLAIALGVLAAGATLLGWLLAAIRTSWPRALQGSVLALAAVAMVVLTVTEILPSAFGSSVSGPIVLAAIGFGVLLVIAMGRIGHRIARGCSPLARTGFIVALAIGLHNIPEGAIPVGMSTISVGAAITAAVVIGVHNIPEGLAIAAPVFADGGSRRRALVFVGLATVGEVAGVLMAAQFATAFTGSGVSLLLAAVGGVMLAVSAIELLPAGITLIRQSMTPAPALQPTTP